MPRDNRFVRIIPTVIASEAKQSRPRAICSGIELSVVEQRHESEIHV